MKLQHIFPAACMICAVSSVFALTLGTPKATGTTIDKIDTFIAQKYPGARIVERDHEHNLIEVEIRHERIKKNVYFTSDYQWVRSDWDISTRKLPSAVKETVSKRYAKYRIDDADYIETPQGAYYDLELDRRWSDDEIHISVTPQGKVK